VQLAIDKFGRMVIPKAIRGDLGLEPGDHLEITERDGTILLRPVKEQQVVQQRDGVLVYSGEGTANVGDAVREGREQRLAHSSGWRK